LGLNADRVGPNAQSYVLSFSVSGGQGAELPASFGTLAWEHRWWAVGAQACRFGLGLLSWLRLEPCASVHGGRYQAELLAGSSSTDWLVLAELTAQLRVSSGPWVGRVELGGFAPVSPLVMRRDGEAFYQQGLGVTVGLSVAVLPLTFSSGGG
jgi:hypothetical protein